MGLFELRVGAARAPRLLCFAHAGGSPRGFAALAQALPHDWSIYALEPPGRVSTGGEMPVRVDDFVAAYLEAVPAVLFESILLGHSLGAYVALTLARAVPERVRGLVIAAATPPHLRSRASTMVSATASDHELVDWLIASGSPGPRPSDDVIQHFAPMLRADLQAYAGFHAVDPPLDPDLPVLACGGSTDALCPFERFSRWREVVPQAEIASVAGGHFFPRTHAERFAPVLRRFVEAHAPLRLAPSSTRPVVP